jgi:hypothetical protein
MRTQISIAFLVRPLALNLDAEMGADLCEGDIGLPSTDEPGEDVVRTGVGIGGQECLGREFAGGVTNQQPADRHRWDVAAIPQGGSGGAMVAISTRRMVPPYQRLIRWGSQTTARSWSTAAVARLRPVPATDRFELFYWSNANGRWSTFGPLDLMKLMLESAHEIVENDPVFRIPRTP